MESKLKLSMAQIEFLIREMKASQEQLHHREFPLDASTLIEESAVLKLLQVSSRTMRTYRNKKYLHFIKLQGRIFYLKPVLYLDLLELSFGKK